MVSSIFTKLSKNSCNTHEESLKVKRLNLFILTCLLFVGVWIFLPVNQSLAKPLPAGVEPLPVAGMRVAAYTKEFARRFSLPMPEYELPEGTGLQAIEYAVEKASPRTPLYQSVFYLYLDDSLPIHFPEDGTAGTGEMVNSRNHFFGRTHKKFMRWNKDDRIEINLKDLGYAMKAMFATKDYVAEKKGIRTSVFYEEYNSSLMKGVCYVKLYDFQPLDHNFSTEIKTGKPIQVWLKIENDKNFNDERIITGKNFIRINLPIDWLQKALEYDSVTDKKNKEIKQKRKN